MPGKPIAGTGEVCPFHRKDVSKVCHKCPLWVQVRGKVPQGEEVVDKWACSFALMPMLTIENSQMQRQTGAAVESFRNEFVGRNDVALDTALRLADAMGVATLGASPLRQINGRVDKG